VPNTVTHLIYSHHHADHAGASSLFGDNVVRIGHEETRRLLLRDDDPARPAPTETFQDRRTLDIGGERIELAWHGANHTPDNSIIHLPDHDTLMLIDIVNPGWAPVYLAPTTDLQDEDASPFPDRTRTDSLRAAWALRPGRANRSGGNLRPAPSPSR
jgi:glyoxylase-like metal-dependent hydrolase (beta-lactamase superfamily II)